MSTKKHMTKRWVALSGAGLVAVGILAANLDTVKDFVRQAQARRYRSDLLAELRPERLSNCTLARFGNARDGGYLMCENLLTAVRSAYSYGIEGRDEWGCAIAQAIGVPVHQYDCFATARPRCAGAKFIFHEECIGPAVTDSGGRVFDTLTSQIAKNGDRGNRLVVKMDVEGAEWDAFLTTSETVLGKIDQLVVEFHGTDQTRFLKALRTLKKTFVVVNVHFNNFACDELVRPFPAWAYEVLLVNKGLAHVSLPEASPIPPNPLDRPNNATIPDCQVSR